MIFLDKTIQQVVLKLESLHKTLDEILPKFAKAKSDFENLEEWKKNIHSKNLGTGSVLDRTSTAETSKDYEEHLRGLCEARKTYNSVNAEKTAVVMKIETLRTVVSAKKEEIRNFQG